MHSRYLKICSLAVVLLAFATTAPAVALLDRFYQFGDSPDELTTDGGFTFRAAMPGELVPTNSIFTTFDEAFTQFDADESITLTVNTGPQPGNNPAYVSTATRPDGNGGIGIDFDGTDDFMNSVRLGLPSTSFTHNNATNNYDYTGVSNRGYQLWVNIDPFTAGPTAAQTIVADTNQHVARINEAGNLEMVYAGNAYDSGVNVEAGGWYHLMVVRPAGAAGGSRFYINGEVKAFGPGGYNGADDADLVIGANTAGDGGSGENPQGFLGGTDEFFGGVVDDLKMFVIGSVTLGPNPNNSNIVEAFTSTFNPGVDNDFINFKLTEPTGSVVAGDLNLDGVFDGGSLAGLDRAAFLGGWFENQLFNGVAVGDLNSYAKGDLDFDGRIGINDLLAFQTLISGAPGGLAITPGELAGGTTVPEPTTLVLVGIALGGLALARRCA